MRDAPEKIGLVRGILGLRLWNKHEDNDQSNAIAYTRSDLVAEHAVTEAGRGLLRIVEEIDGALNHGTWRDENGMRFKDTPEWVAFYIAIKAAMEAGLVSDPSRDHNT